MIKQRSLLLPLALLLNIMLHCSIHARGKRSDQTFTSASVLPVINHENTKYLILAREAFGRTSRGTYDDFGGGREDNETPLITAAREFHEEGILQDTIGFSISDVRNYIDTDKTDNTKYTIVYSKGRKKNITYITKFNPYKRKFLDTFYHARKQTKAIHSKEKDRIAIVAWGDLKRALIRTNKTKNVKVTALILRPKTGQYRSSFITLRSFFVKKLRPFFRDETYKHGLVKKIRFYSE